MEAEDPQIVLAGELRALAKRLIDRALKPLGKQRPLDKAGKINKLCELAKTHFPVQWENNEKEAALESLIATAIGRLDESETIYVRDAPKDKQLGLRKAAYLVYNIAAPDYGVEKFSLDHLDGEKQYEWLVARLKAEIEGMAGFEIGESTLGRRLTDLRRKLARTLLDPRFPFIAVAADPGMQPNDQPAQSSANPIASPGGALSRVLRFSTQLANDIDVVSASPGEEYGIGAEATFTAGLYVERKVEQAILQALKIQPEAKNGSPSLVVVGEAGYGKSSLLWSLHRRLLDWPGVQPILINAVWLSVRASDQDVLLLAEELVEACAEVRRCGARTIVLLDTADLSLHSDTDRLRVLELHESLLELDASIVTTCRPQEAKLLPKRKFERIVLGHYDTDELKDAINKHVRFFCPDAAPRPIEEKLKILLGVESGGVSVARACWSPLMLRLLFEAYGSAFPSSQIDVQGIFEAYFERRIKRDVRGEMEVQISTRAQDYSFVAYSLAIAMLGLGTPEPGRLSLVTSSLRVAGSWIVRDQWRAATSPDSFERAIDALVARSVLLKEGLGAGHLRYRHQLLFEFIAACALLERDGMTGARYLMRRLEEKPMDLFCGAVLEQMLIYAWRSRLYDRPHIKSLIERLSTNDHIGLRSVALVVSAYYPDAVEGLEALIGASDKTALRRFVGLIPEVSRTTIAQKMLLLRLVWHATEAPREAVYEALERLAVEHAEPVFGFFKEVEQAQDGGDRTIIPDANVLFSERSLIRALALLGSVNKKWVESRLLEAFDVVCGAGKSRDTAIEIIRSVTDNWPSLRSDDFLTRLLDRVQSAQSENYQRGAVEVRNAVGGLMAREWQIRFSFSNRPEDVSAWFEEVKRIGRAIESDVEDVLANCQLVGIGYFLDSLDDERVIEASLDSLLKLAPPSAPYCLGRSVLPNLLVRRTRAGDRVREVVVRLLEGLPAPTNRAKPGMQMWAAVAREALSNAQLPAETLSTVLARTSTAKETALWTDRGGLSAFMLSAALSGHEAANRALAEAIDSPETVPEEVRRSILWNFPRSSIGDQAAMSKLIILARAWKLDGPLREIAESGDPRIEGILRRYREELSKLVESLLEGNVEDQRQGVLLWSALDAIRATNTCTFEEMKKRWSKLPEVGARGNLLLIMAEHVVRGDIPALEAETFLKGIIEVDGDPPALIARSRSRHPTLLSHARLARLRIHAASFPLKREEARRELLTLAAAEPTDAGVLGQSRIAIQRLADSGEPLLAFKLFEGVVECAQDSRLNERSHRKLANVLRTPLRHIFKAAGSAERRRLAMSVRTLPSVYAEMLASTSIQAAFEDVQDIMGDAAGGSVPDAVKSRIQGELQIRMRLGGTEPMEGILEPL